MNVHTWRIRSVVTAVAMIAGLCLPALTVQAAQAATTPSSAPAFYHYTGSTPLATIKPGTVLKTRSFLYRLEGIPLPLRVTQLLYRTADQLGRPSVNVTSVLKAPLNLHPHTAVSYQSFYDSLNPADSPSYAIAGGHSFGALIPHVETLLIAPLLLEGYNVVVADTQGETADFAAGPEYGTTTLDSIRAVSGASATGIASDAKIGMIGYSGGAIATNWAAALAPAYAPDVNKRLLGAAEGGVLVDPAHNLNYIQGSQVWAGVLVMALVGVARGSEVDLSQYLNDYGKQVYAKLQNASIATVLGAYPGLTWAKIAKPQYAKPESVPIYVRLVNKLNLGSAASPTVPMFIGQGANGIIEGTSGSTPGIGKGDGVMIAGDVRSLARQYCASGTKVSYHQYDLTSHFTSMALWLPEAYAWLNARLAGLPAPSNCGSIAAGNPLTPVR